MSRIRSVLFLAVLGLVFPQISAVKDFIDYYITAENVIWDYASTGKNLATSDKESYKTFLEHGPDRIGHRYHKAIYKQYTDESYTKEIEKPEWLGFLGPILSGSVGQTMRIHFKNMADRNFSMHPHGVFYNKDSEGALYLDDTKLKADDEVQPSHTHTYIWEVKEFDSPADGDPDCLPWMYHSHVDPVKDMNTGLMGMLLTCKKGKTAVLDKSFTLLLKVMDENLSWYLDKNIQAFIPNSSVDPEDEDFQESNKMHSMNGLMYGHLKDLNTCMGDNITWYLMGMGNEVDIHTINFHGQSLVYNHHRTDSISLYPAEFAVATMKVNLPGTWLVLCHVHDHFVGGMTALMTVNKCVTDPDLNPNGKVIKYYIAAELVRWNYSQNGQNLFDGGSLTEADSDSEVFFKKGPSRIGGQYVKALYREYTDGTFSKRKERSKEEEHLGFLGPVIRASVGDIVKVEFYNMADKTFSMHPFGFFYDKFSEGSDYKDHVSHKMIQNYNAPPETVKTYTWRVTEDMGPLPDDPPCITRMYASMIDYMRDTYSGLVGPMLICKKGALDDNGKQKNVDKEFFLLFSVSDENKSWYIDENIRRYTTDKNIDKDDEDFQESNLMHGINGYLYGNLPGLDMCVGDRVNWHIMSVGNEVDLHTAFFHGNSFTINQNHKDSSAILPGMFKTLSMVTVNSGIWELACRTNDHFNAGTKALYHVNKCGKSIKKMETGKERIYYIAAVEVEWEYAENHTDYVRGGSLDDPDNAGNAFVKSSDTLIGSKYLKAVYREYTDGSFKTAKPHPPHLGILGPVIRANVGDTIKVVFYNKATFPFSIQPHGVVYDKKNEGAAYEDKVDKTLKKGSIIMPNKKYQYTWIVPESSGPGPKDPTCIGYAYYSAVNPSKDTNSGLVGPLVICRKDTLMKPDFKEFPLLFTVFDENASNYLEKNIQKYCKRPEDVDTENEEFLENNKNHGINGLLYGNLNTLIMDQDETIYWYLLGLGTEVDIHSVHFHGNTFLQYTDYKHRKDTIDLWPGVYSTVVMEAKNPGKWLLHCHVDDHIIGGMETTYIVRLHPSK